MNNIRISVIGMKWKTQPNVSSTLYKDFVKIFNTQYTPIEINNRHQGEILIKAARNLNLAKIDGDFIYCNDSMSPYALSILNPSFEDYFSNILKIFQIDWPMIKDNRKKVFNLSILQNCYYVDVILISEYYSELVFDKLKKHYSTEIYNEIKEKTILIPPSGIYKFENCLTPKNFSKLSFIWNHRFASIKNYKIYFEILSNFHIKYPDIPFELYIMCDSKKKILKFIPKNIISNCIFMDFIFDSEKYSDFLKNKINIGIGTSKAESFGICAIEHIKTGSCFLNLECNESFSKIIGNKYTIQKNKCVDLIAKCYYNKNYRNDNILYHFIIMIQNIINVEEYKNRILNKLNQVFNKHIHKKSKTPLIEKIIDYIQKNNIVTKKDIFEYINWDINTMKYWASIYYGLRKHSIQLTYYENIPYFHDKNVEFKPRKEKKTINDLF